MKIFLNLMLVCAFLLQCNQNTATAQTSKSPTTKEAGVKPVNPYYSRTDRTKLNVSNKEWKKILPPEVYAIAREADTEYPFTGKYNDFDEVGEYYCTVCGNHLFRSSSKFASTCGWPSFFEADPQGVTYQRDNSYGMKRIEVLCKRCDSHLGHVFEDGPPPTGKRYCMNSVSLDFERDKK